MNTFDPRNSEDQVARDWKIFTGRGEAHDGLASLPAPPPWRFAYEQAKLTPPPTVEAEGEDAERRRAMPFIVSDAMKIAVNAALYLRRPLLLTGKPGTGKSTLVAKVAHELRMGSVLRWPINSRSTVRNGIYEYDAVGRLQAGRNIEPPVQDYLKLGPLGTALLASDWPRAVLIDEIDKSDLDFANDLLNVIEEGEFEIPELRRLALPSVKVQDFEGNLVSVEGGRLKCRQFPFVVMTSNAEREFPAPFLRRCVRLKIDPPDTEQLLAIVRSHLEEYEDVLNFDEIGRLVALFDSEQKENQDVGTDQVLNAVFLSVAMKDVEGRTFSKEELNTVRQQLMQPLSGQGT
ncbi:MoxR-like ATPase [Paraburkholderia youngii]|uniref:AAA family ATPase n=1 Tax=Paraburkholderia youngii TaxID=2782701 RepID=UPI003D1D28FD